MKKFSLLIMLCLIGLLSSPVFANKIVELSAPSPRIHGQITVGESHTYTYRIKNNALGHRFKIDVRGLKQYMVRTKVSNDCENTLPTGPSTCKIGITVAPTKREAGKWIHEHLEIQYAHPGSVPLRDTIEFQVPSLPVYAAVGINGDDNTPLIASSNDSTGKGQTWYVQSPKNYPGILNASNCMGSYPDTLCVAVGFRNIDSALILTSLNGGEWSEPTYIPVKMPLTDVTCRGNSTRGFCIAISTSPAVSREANGYGSIDAGKSWHLIKNFQSDVSLMGLSCSGNERDFMCAVVAKTGEVFVSTYDPLRWKTINLNDQLSSVSCLGGSETGICVITSTNGAYVIKAQSIDTIPSKIVLSPNVTLTTSTCTGTPSDPICVLGGYSVDATTHLNVPKVYVTNTPGLTNWNNPAIQDYLPGSVAVASLACTGSGPTAICIAVGNETLLGVSQDGGLTWKQKAETRHHYLFGASCNYVPKDPPTVTCLATGSSRNLRADPFPEYAGIPDLFVSPDGGSTWYHSPVTDSPEKGGYLGIGVTL